MVSTPSVRLPTKRKFYEEILSETNEDKEVSLAEYVRSLHNNSYTLEALLLLGLLDKGTRSLSSAKIMSYKFLIVKHQFFDAPDVSDCRKAVCAAKSLDSLPRFIRYSSVRSLHQLTEIYTGRNVNKFTGPSDLFPGWKQFWAIHKNGPLNRSLPSSLEVLELTGFHNAMGVVYKALVYNLHKLSILITESCEITQIVYNLLPKRRSLKALICLSHSYECYKAPLRKEFIKELAIVPNFHNSNRHYIEVKKARKFNRRRSDNFTRFGCRGKVFLS
uniref:FBD domain-containing protein n=1 Tax=Strongyloides papillosus TaxID=174720 RepID=A0A0N5C204_STREA